MTRQQEIQNVNAEIDELVMEIENIDNQILLLPKRKRRSLELKESQLQSKEIQLREINRQRRNKELQLRNKELHLRNIVLQLREEENQLRRDKETPLNTSRSLYMIRYS